VTSVHDRPRLARIIAPGRKSNEEHNAISREYARLLARESDLKRQAADSMSPFAASLASEQAQRVRDRINLIKSHWKRIGRPNGPKA
jgi:excinuclease UvrABC nuclease subunit